MSVFALDGSLVALDVDGTLLRSDGSLSPRTIEALDAAKRAGATLSLVTGRDWTAVRDLLLEVPAVDYCLCVNGTEVLRADGFELHAEILDAEVARTAIPVLREAVPGVALGLGVGGELVGEPLIAEVLPPGVGHVLPVDDALAAVGPDLRDIVVYHPDYRSDLDGLYELCRKALPVEGLDLAFSGLPMLEIVPPGAGKDSGLAWLANHLDVANESVVAFGDGLNDLSMLRWAGTGVAMGQASDVVQEVADEVALPNDEDGVAVWLEDWLPET